ncbi:MAG TPA: hemolysin family protein [Spongiibacteraceae bacterium]|jgi:CBS domain containing-hemolysin-like protein|nr:hemolysin family protein [Spongiibacteraceae bacterium]HUH38016.1 hemolysin family protein [Spongiibacteraceae bacterium]
MALLIVYVVVALGFSFLCSIAEAVLLSVTPAYIALQEKESAATAQLLRRLKDDINRPLAAILTLNTIAHTMGAAGAGAQAAALFGNAYLGLISAVLTLLILVLSEIIPKTLGAQYWRRLAPLMARVVQVLIWLLWPLVKMAEWMTRSLTNGPTLRGFNRQELGALAEISSRSGDLDDREARLLHNALALPTIKLKEIMTPRTVVFGVPATLTVGEFFDHHQQENFSRVPVYRDDVENVVGFVLRNELLLAKASGESDRTMGDFLRELTVASSAMPLSRALELILRRQAQIMLVVDEYGGVEGVVTLEDFLETLLGEEIVDESDTTTDMQLIARRLGRRRARRLGVSEEGEAELGDAS